MAVSNSTDRFNGVVVDKAIKVSCAVASDIDLPLTGTGLVNGVSVVTDDRVLVRSQTNPIENGIYCVRDGAWERAPDWDGNRDITRGTLVPAYDSAGDLSLYEVTSTTEPLRPGTDPVTIEFYLQGSAGAALEPGTITNAMLRWDGVDTYRETDRIRATAQGANLQIYESGLTNFLDISYVGTSLIMGLSNAAHVFDFQQGILLSDSGDSVLHQISGSDYDITPSGIDEVTFGAVNNFYSFQSNVDVTADVFITGGNTLTIFASDALSQLDIDVDNTTDVATFGGFNLSKILFSGPSFAMAEMTAPTVDVLGQGQFYVDTADAQPYFRDELGNVLSLGGGGGVSGPWAMPYLFTTDITFTDPGSTYLKFNNADPTAATFLYISTSDANSVNRDTTLLASIDTGWVVKIQELDDSATEPLIYSVGLNQIDQGDWWYYTIQHISGTALPANDANLSITITPEPYFDIPTEDGKIPVWSTADDRFANLAAGRGVYVNLPGVGETELQSVDGVFILRSSSQVRVDAGSFYAQYVNNNSYIGFQLNGANKQIITGTSGGDLLLSAGNGNNMVRCIGGSTFGMTGRAAPLTDITGVGQIYVDTDDDGLYYKFDGDAAFRLDAAGGTIGGSITDNQIAVGATTANDIEGSSALTWASPEFRLDVANVYIHMLGTQADPAGEAGYGSFFASANIISDVAGAFNDDNGEKWILQDMNAHHFAFSTLTSASDPGTGLFKFDNATPASVTNIYIDDLAMTGQDMHKLMSTLSDGDLISIQNSADTRYWIGTVNGTPTDNTGWWTIPVTHVQSNATLFGSTTLCQIDVQYLSHAVGSGGSPFTAPLRILGDTNGAPPNTGTGLLEFYDSDESDRLAYIGHEGNTDLRIRNLNDGGAILIQATDSAGTQRTILDADPDNITTLRADSNLLLEAGAGTDAILCTGGTDVALYYAGVEVARTMTAALGAWEVDNDLNGGSGFERVMTESDIVRKVSGVFEFNAGVGGGDPGGGHFAFNSATLGSITTMSLDDQTIQGNHNVEAHHPLLSDGDILYFRDEGADSSLIMEVTGAPTDQTGYWSVPVNYIAGVLPTSSNQYSMQVQWLSNAGGTGLPTPATDHSTLYNNAGTWTESVKVRNAEDGNLAIYSADDAIATASAVAWYTSSGALRAEIGPGTNGSDFVMTNWQVGQNVELRSRNAADSATRTFLDGDPDGVTIIRGNTTVQLYGGNTILALRAGSTVTELLHAGTEVAQTETLANGGFSVHNDYNGSDGVGFDRVWTETQQDWLGATALYDFDSGTANANPGNGQLRFNNATPASVTALYVDYQLFAGTRQGNWLWNSLSDGDLICIRSNNDIADYWIGTVNGSVTDQTTYFEVPLTHVRSGTLPTAGDLLNVSVQYLSEAGGAAGVTTFEGRSGAVVANAADYADVSTIFTADQTIGGSASLILTDDREIRFGNGADMIMDFDGTGNHFVMNNGSAADGFQWNDVTVTKMELDMTGERLFLNDGFALLIEEDSALPTGAAGFATIGVLNNTPTEFWFRDDNAGEAFLAARGLKLTETSAIPAPSAGFGTYAVKNDAPSQAFFATDIDQEYGLMNVVTEIDYRFDTSTISADPLDGDLRYDNATPASITNIYVDDLDSFSRSQDNFWLHVQIGDIIEIFSIQNTTRYQRFRVTGAPTDNTGWHTIPVESIDAGTLHSSAENIRVRYSAHGGNKLQDYSISNVATTPTGTTETLTYEEGPAFEVDLESVTGNITITLSGGPPSGDYGQITVLVTQDSATARTITWAGGTFEWVNDTAHVMNATLNGYSLFTFETWDGGTTWFAAGANYGA